MMVQNSSIEEKKRRKRKKVDSPATNKKVAVPAAVNTLSELDADDFMASFGGSDGETEPAPVKQKALKGKKGKKGKAAKIVTPVEEEIQEEPAVEEEGTKRELAVTTAVTTGKEMVEGISRLEEKDADFYKFLQENDPDLLNFSGESEDDSMDEDSEEEKADESDSEKEEGEDGPEEPMEVAPEEKESTFQSTAITKPLLNKWEQDLKRNSLPSWRQLVKAFQSAVATAKGADPEVELKYTIIDPDMVNKVIMLSLGHTVDLLKHHLGENPTASPKWPKVKMSLKSYLTSLTELLGWCFIQFISFILPTG